MRFNGRNIRIRCSFETGLWLFACLLVPPGLCAAAQETACTQQRRSASTQEGLLTTEEVVEKLVGMNFRRAQALHSYHGTRTYRMEYRSSIKTMSAEMVVEVKYLAPETKDFTIQSSTGSKLIIDKVFAKILQAEHDAVSTDAQRQTALSRDNYDFAMAGYEVTPSRSMYVLVVEPKTKNKFLFRGRVWVDADDFAVVRIEAEPARNPSFWTKNNKIDQSYIKVNDFWLPERNHSISSIRLGGSAELTIEYENYQITAADPVGSALAHEIARTANTSRTFDCRQTSLRHSAEAGPCLSTASEAMNQHQLPNRSQLLPERQAAATDGTCWQQDRR